MLTVSDIDRAAERGAIIQFANERNRLRLRINVQKARSAGLTLSSKLLRPGRNRRRERGLAHEHRRHTDPPQAR